MDKQFSEEARQAAVDLQRYMKLLLNSHHGAVGPDPGTRTPSQLQAPYIDTIMKWASQYGDIRLKRVIRVYRRTKNRRIKQKVWFFIIDEVRAAQGLASVKSIKHINRSVQKFIKLITFDRIVMTDDKKLYARAIDLNDIKVSGIYAVEETPHPPMRLIQYEEGWVKPIVYADDVTIPPKEVDLDEEEA